MLDLVKCYKILDLEPGAQAERVRKAYLKLAHEWDPDRHEKNPLLRFHAEQKREEIEEAYRTIRRFRSDLPPGEGFVPGPFKQDRDFMDMSRGFHAGRSKTALGIFLAVVSLSLLASGYYFLMKSAALPGSQLTSKPVE